MSPLNLSSLRTNLSGGVRAVEQLEVPVASDRQGDLMKAAQVFEDVLDARVELGHKRGGGRLHASGHVSPQRFQLVNNLLQQVQIDRDFGLQFVGGHRSTRARFSMSRVKGVGGARGTRSSTMSFATR